MSSVLFFFSLNINFGNILIKIYDDIFRIEYVMDELFV